MSKNKTYTAQQVRDAYFAHQTNADAKAQGWTPAQTIRSLVGGFLNAAQLTKSDTARYNRGKALLRQAKLVTSRRARIATAAARMACKRTKKRAHGAVVKVSAGHIATSPAVRYIGLRSK